MTIDKIILERYKNKILEYDKNDSKFRVKINQGDKTVTRYSTNSLTKALLTLYEIYYDISTIKLILEDIDLEDYNLFECRDCGEIKDISERCEEHYSYYDNICKSCCEECRDNQAYDDKVNEMISNIRNK